MISLVPEGFQYRNRQQLRIAQILSDLNYIEPEFLLIGSRAIGNFDIDAPWELVVDGCRHFVDEKHPNREVIFIGDYLMKIGLDRVNDDLDEKYNKTLPGIMGIRHNDDQSISVYLTQTKSDYAFWKSLMDWCRILQVSSVKKLPYELLYRIWESAMRHQKDRDALERREKEMLPKGNILQPDKKGF